MTYERIIFDVAWFMQIFGFIAAFYALFIACRWLWRKARAHD
jgi:membrane associated rhomboid family serine protease